MRFALLLALLFLDGLSFAQTNAPTAGPATPPTKPAAAKMSHAQLTAAQLQKALDQLTQSNRDLLDLLKKQQAVLEDMQFDRRLQSRQIESLEERLTQAQLQNVELQNKIDKLEAGAPGRPPAYIEPAVSTTPQDGTVVGKPFVPPVIEAGTSTNGPSAQPAPTQTAEAPPPSTYLPPAPEEAPGTKSWHRLFTLKGDDNRQSDLFHIEGRTWRVLWHNQDKPEKVYQNTSALFINAFPKDDTIPQQVCSKLGTGGDLTDLQGPGNFYLKIEASGGSWELAVEDFR